MWKTEPGENRLRELKSIKPAVNPKVVIPRRLRRAAKALAGHYWENLYLCEKLGPSASAGTTREHTRHEQNKYFLDLIRKMIVAIEGDWGALQEEVGGLFERLKTDSEVLKKWVDPLVDHKLLSTYQLEKVSRSSVLVRLPGLPGEMPVRIEFSDTDIVKLAKKLDRMIKDTDLVTLGSLREDLMEISMTPRASSEWLLLAGYILAMEKKWDLATTELEGGLAKGSGEIDREIDYLLGVIYRKQADWEQAAAHLRRAFDGREYDPRYKLEYSNVLWQATFDLEKRQEVSERRGRLKEALRYAKEAWSGCEAETLEPEFRSEILNMWIFLESEIGIRDLGELKPHLERANVKLSELEALLAEKSWAKKFFDTRGWLRVGQSRLPADPEEQERLLRDSIKDFDEALADKDLFDWKRKRIEVHKSEALAALKLLGGDA